MRALRRTLMMAVYIVMSYRCFVLRDLDRGFRV